MARDGSGNYSLPAGQPVSTGTVISSTVHNTLATDLATALTASLAKDGQTTPTANLPMGGFRHTGVADGNVRTTYASVGQVQDRTSANVGSVAGTDTITGVLNPAITTYVAGMIVTLVAAATNLTTTPTLALNGLAAKTIIRYDGTAIVAGDLTIAKGAVLYYDGANFVLLNPFTSGVATGSRFLAGAGAVGAPSFSFSGHLTTGLYDASGSLAVAIGGADVANFGASGLNVVGTQMNVTNAGAVNVKLDGGGLNFLQLRQSAQAANEKNWLIFNNGKHFQINAYDDAISGSSLGFQIQRGTGTAIASLTLGNTTDKPTINANGAIVQQLDLGSTTGLTLYNTSTTDGRSLIQIRNDRSSTQIWTLGIDALGGTTKAFNIRNVTGATVPVTIATNDDVTFTGHVIGPVGAVGTPAFTFVGDTTNGLYRIGSNDWGLAANGALVLEILAGKAKYLTFEVGFREIPQNPQAGNYTLALTDSGKHIYHASGDGAGDTYTIPANGTVAFPIGTAITFINSDSNAVSIAITTDTMTLAGTTTTGTRTLGQNGMATAVKVTATAWIISGTGLT